MMFLLLIQVTFVLMMDNALSSLSPKHFNQQEIALTNAIPLSAHPSFHVTRLAIFPSTNSVTNGQFSTSRWELSLTISQNSLRCVLRHLAGSPGRSYSREVGMSIPLH